MGGFFYGMLVGLDARGVVERENQKIESKKIEVLSP
jgi:hypothetical protein